MEYEKLFYGIPPADEEQHCSDDDFPDLSFLSTWRVLAINGLSVRDAIH